jgi:hypothetical protein
MKRNKNDDKNHNYTDEELNSDRKVYDFNYINELCFFIIKSEKKKLLNFIKKNNLKQIMSDSEYRFTYIFDLGDFYIYYKEGYVIIKTNIMCYEIYEVGNKYYEYDLEIKDFLNHFGINGSQPIILNKNKFLKKINNLSNSKCEFNKCQNKCELSCKYCLKHLELSGLKIYLLNYINNNIWLEDNNIIKRLNIK